VEDSPAGTDVRPSGADPEHEALIADSVGLALLAVLDPQVELRADGA
jgi:hypothetical protein